MAHESHLDLGTDIFAYGMCGRTFRQRVSGKAFTQFGKQSESNLRQSESNLRLSESNLRLSESKLLTYA